MSGFHRGPFKFLPKGLFSGKKTEKTDEEKLQEAIDKFEKLHINDYDNYNEKDRELISKIMQFLHSSKFLNSSLGKTKFEFNNNSGGSFNDVPYENLKSEDLIGKELDTIAGENVKYENYLDVFKGFTHEIPEEVKQKIAEDAYVFGVVQDEPNTMYASDKLKPLNILKQDLGQKNLRGIIPFIASQMDSLQKKVQAGTISEFEKKGGKRGKKTRKGKKSKKARKSHKKRSKSHRKKQ